MKEVYVKPRNNTVRAKRAFEASEGYQGLNRVELLRVRWTGYKPLEAFKEALVSGQLQEPLLGRAKRQMTEMTSPQAPFAGMCRYFINEEWGLDLS